LIELTHVWTAERQIDRRSQLKWAGPRLPEDETADRQTCWPGPGAEGVCHPGRTVRYCYFGLGWLDGGWRRREPRGAGSQRAGTGLIHI